MTKPFHETRIELIRRIAREAHALRQLNVSAFADEFVPLAHSLAVSAFDESNLRLPHPTDGAQHEKDRTHNRQIVDRWLKGTVAEFPVEFEEPWVLALPGEWRDQALAALAARYGLLAARARPGHEGLESFSELLASFSGCVDTAAPILADGKIDQHDLPYAKPALMAINDLQSKLSTYEAQLIRILPDEQHNVIPMRSAG